MAKRKLANRKSSTPLGQLINLVSDIALGDPAERAKDTLGRVYEYFIRPAHNCREQLA